MYILGDIGNTETKLYLVSKNNKILKKVTFISKKVNIRSLNYLFIKNKLHLNKIEKILFCSVVPKTFKIIKKYLSKKKLTYKDLGPENDKSVDYPIYAHNVAKKVKANKNNIGILICGSGTGMNITANKHKNIRAAQCFNLKSTKLSRLHNDANIITLGARLLSKKNALNFVGIFLKTKFEGGRHSKRIRKI